MHKNKVYRNLLLPKSLYQELGQLAKGKTLNNCYYILWSILGINKRAYRNLQSYRPLPQNRLYKMIGRHYNKPLNILLENFLIERTEEFGVGLCFQYRIDPRFYATEEWVSVKFYYNQKTEDSRQYENNKKERETFIKNFMLLEIPFEKLYSKIDDTVRSINIEDYKTDVDVDWVYPKMDVTEIDEDWQLHEHKALTKKEALLIGDLKNKIIVFDGKKIVMVDPDYFIMEQKNFTRIAWTMAVDNLADESTLYAKRNDTNNRLDTNFTNLASELDDIIKAHNIMGEKDAMNSQPALLSHILKEEGVQGEDVELFHELTRERGFYEYFDMERKDAKRMIFMVFFGKNRTKNLMTERFKETFPTVSNWIREYKAEHGDNAFANLLQTFESQLFIDGVYYALCEAGVPIFTKHDSISFFRHDEDKVAEVLEKEFAKIQFKGKIKTTYPKEAA